MAKAQELPQAEKELLATLHKEQLWRRVQELNEAGWSLQSIANGFIPEKRRSTIRSWVVKELPEREVITAGFPIPKPPVKKVKSRRKRVPSPGIPLDEQLRIARLSPLARRYRARTAPSSSSFTANVELTSIAGVLYSKGVTVSELARASGVTYRAMKRRVDKATQ
jgi:hypothetical protein